MMSIGGGKRGGYGRWRWWHGLLALVAGIPMVVQGLTGALLGYEREIRNGLGEGAIEASGERLGLIGIADAAERQLGPGEPAWMIWFGPESEPAWVRWRGVDGRETSHLFNPYTGELLPESTRWHRRYEVILAIHRRLGMGSAGKLIMGTSALLLTGLVLSGLALQWKRSPRLRAFLGMERLGATVPGIRRWRWLHGGLGIWLSPVLLLMALTGPVWSFSGYRAVVGWLTQSEPEYGTAAVEVAEMGPPDTARVLAAAECYQPATGAMRVVLSADRGRPSRFEWAPPEAPYENFRSRILLHPATGEELGSYLLDDYTRAERVIRRAYPLHTGKWGGSVSQFLHFLAALAVPFFTLSGLWLYARRKRLL